MGKFSKNLSRRLRGKPIKEAKFERIEALPGESFLAWIDRTMPITAAETTKEILSEHIGVEGRGIGSGLREWTNNRNQWVSKFADDIINEDIAECKRGCASCCHQNVMCDPMEAFEIAAHLFRPARTTLTEEQQDALLERIRAVAALPVDLDVRWGVACPLLENNECTVYDIRPSPCRTFLSTSRARCEESLRAHDLKATVEVPGLPGKVNDLWFDGSVPVLARYVQLHHVTPVELCRALALIASDFQGIYDRWLFGEDVFVDCRMDHATVLRTATEMKAAGLGDTKKLTELVRVIEDALPR